MSQLLWILHNSTACWLASAACLLALAGWWARREPRVRARASAKAVWRALGAAKRRTLDERHLGQEVVLEGTLASGGTCCEDLTGADAPAAATAAFPDDDRALRAPHAAQLDIWAPALALLVEDAAVRLEGPVRVLVGSNQFRPRVSLRWVGRKRARPMARAAADATLLQRLSEPSLQLHALRAGDRVSARGRLGRMIDAGVAGGYRDSAAGYALTASSPNHSPAGGEPTPAIELAYAGRPRVQGPSAGRLALVSLLVLAVFGSLTTIVGTEASGLLRADVARIRRGLVAGQGSVSRNRPETAFVLAALSPLHRRSAAEWLRLRASSEEDLAANERLQTLLALNRLGDRCSDNFALLAADGREDLLADEIDSCPDVRAAFALYRLGLLQETSQWLRRHRWPLTVTRYWQRWVEAHLAAGHYGDAARRIEAVLARRVARIRAGAARTSEPDVRALLELAVGANASPIIVQRPALAGSPSVTRLRCLGRATRALQLVEPMLERLRYGPPSADQAPFPRCDSELGRLVDLDRRKAWFERWSRPRGRAPDWRSEAATVERLLARAALDTARLLGVRRDGCTDCSPRLRAALGEAFRRLEFLAQSQLVPCMTRSVADLGQSEAEGELVAGVAMLSVAVGRELEGLALVRRQQGWTGARAAGLAVLWPSARLRLLPQLKRVIMDQVRGVEERLAVIESLQSCNQQEAQAVCEVLSDARGLSDRLARAAARRAPSSCLAALRKPVHRQPIVESQNNMIACPVERRPRGRGRTIWGERSLRRRFPHRGPPRPSPPWGVP